MTRGPEESRPTGSSNELSRLSWSEVEERIAADPRLLLAVGSLEQHGRHLPLGTSTIIAQRVVEETSERTGVVRAPPLHYGVGAPARGSYAGAASLRRKTLHRIVNEILAAWEDAGFQELIIVTANHFEPHLDALLMALTSRSQTTVIDLRSIPADDILDADPHSEHAGELETSLLLHLVPESVRLDQVVDHIPDSRTFRKYVRGRRPTPPRGTGGVVGRPSRATREKGEELFNRYVTALCERVLDTERADPNPASEPG